MVADWIECLEKRPAHRTGEDLDIIYACLKHTMAFERFHPSLLHEICYYGYYQELDGGITLFRQGDIGTNFYCVLNGMLDVNVPPTDKHEDATTICTLTTGAVFGESVLDDSPRHATVITSEYCELILVDKNDFRAIWERNKKHLECIISQPQNTLAVNANQAEDTGTVTNDNSGAEDSTEMPLTLAYAGRVLYSRMKYHSEGLIKCRKHNSITYQKCFVGMESISWLCDSSAHVHSRFHAKSTWQTLLEEEIIKQVDNDIEFKDQHVLYYFTAEEDDGTELQEFCADDFQAVLLRLGRTGPDAMLRMALRKPPIERTQEDQDIIYEELLHIKSLQHLSTLVKKQLAAVFVLQICEKKRTVLFNQGEEGEAWYIILKGAIDIVIRGKGPVCQLHEGDEFGKLALVNNAPRSASIETRYKNCQFLKIGKEDFNRILKGAEANTVRLKEHGRDVLILEKMSIRNVFQNTTHSHPKYYVMAGTPEKMLEQLVEAGSNVNKIDCNEEDAFLNEFLLTYPVFMSTEVLCSQILSIYVGANALETDDDENSNQVFKHTLGVKKRVVQIILHWKTLAADQFLETSAVRDLIQEIAKVLKADALYDEYNKLKTAIANITHRRTPPVINNNASQRNVSLVNRGSSSETQEMQIKQIKRPIKAADQNTFRIHFADHTYTTLRVRYDTKAEVIAKAVEERIQIGKDCVLCEVKSSGERVPIASEQVGVTDNLSVNGRLFIAPREHLDSLTPLPEQEGPKSNSLSSLEMMSSTELAYHLTLFDHELFSSINIYEFVYHTFGREKFKKITSNLDAFLMRFNEVQYWVATEILLTPQLNKRAHLLRKFIKIAAHCQEYNNWHSFFAIIMGLNNVSVSRLSQTWEKLPSKYRKTYDEFEATLEPSRNHRVYRSSVGKMKPPVIPFMPLLMKDVTFVNQGNQNHFDDLVNFEKMRMIASSLHLVQYCRSAPFAAEMPSPAKNTIDIQSYVQNLSAIDNQRTLTQLSQRLEPRKT